MYILQTTVIVCVPTEESHIDLLQNNMFFHANYTTNDRPTQAELEINGQEPMRVNDEMLAAFYRQHAHFRERRTLQSLKELIFFLLYFSTLQNLS